MPQKMKSADRKAIVASIKNADRACIGSMGAIYWGPEENKLQFQLMEHSISGHTITLNKDGQRIGYWAYSETDWNYIQNQIARTMLKS